MTAKTMVFITSLIDETEEVPRLVVTLPSGRNIDFTPSGTESRAESVWAIDQLMKMLASGANVSGGMIIDRKESH